MFNRDLMYICECYEEWPVGIDKLFYSDDGEVLGTGDRGTFNDYPRGVLKDPSSNENFIPADGYTYTGKDYTKEEFLACKEYLASKTTSTNTPVGEATSPVIEKIKLRIQEITKRHEMALQAELKPLLEVLQRNQGELS